MSTDTSTCSYFRVDLRCRKDHNCLKGIATVCIRSVEIDERGSLKPQDDPRDLCRALQVPCSPYENLYSLIQLYKAFCNTPFDMSDGRSHELRFCRFQTSSNSAFLAQQLVSTTHLPNQIPHTVYKQKSNTS